MGSTAIPLNLDPETKARLERLAESGATEPAVLAGEILRRYLPVYECHLGGIHAGIEDADSGRLVEHERVVAWIEGWGSDSELDQPTCN